MAHQPARSNTAYSLFWKAHTFVLGVAVALPLLAMSTADAASCTSLARQLNQAGGSNSGDHVARQKRHIKTMQIRIARTGCASDRTAGTACRSNKLLLKRMQRNLAKLQSKSSGSVRRSKASIRRVMRRQGCNRSATVHDRAFKKNRTRTASRSAVKATQNFYNSPTVSTYCVREMDGFYIPVSFATNANYFDRDRKACETRCPGVPMELFFHKTEGEFPEDMVAANDQRPYRELPAAFDFQQATEKRIQCDFASIAPPDRLQTVAGDEKRRTLTQVAMLARPTFRPGITLLRGSVVPQRPDFEPTERRVRVVGESFFPVQ